MRLFFSSSSASPLKLDLSRIFVVWLTVEKYRSAICLCGEKGCKSNHGDKLIAGTAHGSMCRHLNFVNYFYFYFLISNLGELQIISIK